MDQHQNQQQPESKGANQKLSDERIQFSRLMLSGAFELYSEDQGLVRELGAQHLPHKESANQVMLDYIGTLTGPTLQTSIDSGAFIAKTDWTDSRVVFLFESKCDEGFVLPTRYNWSADGAPTIKQGKSIGSAGVLMPQHIITREPAALVIEIAGENPNEARLTPIVEAETYYEDIGRFKAIAKMTHDEGRLIEAKEPSFLFAMALEEISTALEDEGLTPVTVTSVNVDSVMSSRIELLCVEPNSNDLLLSSPITKSFTVNTSLSSEGLVSVSLRD